MFSQTFAIGAYQPMMKAEQSGKTSEQMTVVDGRNFAWEGAAVISAYAKAAAPAILPAVPMRHPGIFMIANLAYIFTETAVIRRNIDNTFTTVFTYLTPASAGQWDETQYQWTTGYVGTAHYFCHPSVGIVRFDQFDGLWRMVREDCWNGPTYAICMADNRLVVLLEDVVVWSWFDLGEKFDKLWQSGSGTQSLALIKYGQPYAVRPYGGGFLTFTSMGVMISVPENSQAMHPEGDKLTIGAVIFKHEELTFDDPAVGPAAITSAGQDLVIWLAQNGLRAFAPSQGGGFGGLQNWQAPMGAFYHETMIPDTENSVGDRFMLSYCAELRSIFISSRGASGNYQAAHVYQMDYERWGSFDHPHKVIGPGARGALGGVNYHGAAFIDPAGALVDIVTGAVVDSWVKFSPLRLQLPQEPTLPATTLISVQEIRLGTERGPGHRLANLPFGLISHWQIERFRGRPATKCDVLLSGGWDDNTQNLDEGEYATLLKSNMETAIYVCDVTGLTHSLYVTCTEPDHHFSISHVEASFFFAGQL